jgi:putative alpha-1,2-mannosidase
MGSLLLMPTSGKLEVDYHQYGSTYTQEVAHPGYYSNVLKKYGIKTEVSATTRVGVSKFTFPKGQANILLNLGEGLTNETGATVRYVSDTEIEGSKLLGSFCYTNNQAVYPIFFVMRVNKKPSKRGYWKFQRAGEKWENDWNKDAGKYKIFTDYTDQLSGDDLGAYFSFDVKENESLEVQLAVSFVSVENARKNLDAEQADFSFEKNTKECSFALEQCIVKDTGRRWYRGPKNSVLYSIISCHDSSKSLAGCKRRVSCYGNSEDTCCRSQSLHRVFAMGYVPKCSAFNVTGLS